MGTEFGPVLSTARWGVQWELARYVNSGLQLSELTAQSIKALSTLDTAEGIAKVNALVKKHLETKGSSPGIDKSQLQAAFSREMAAKARFK